MLFVTAGSALIGATAVTIALVMFSLQVNVERMPYGLFRKLSFDARLIASFAGTFLLSIAIASLSVVTTQRALAYCVAASMSGSISVLVLILYAYRRALSLISPTQQLVFVTEDARRQFMHWVKRTQRLEPLLETPPERASDNSTPGTSHDLSRLAFFQFIPSWTSGPLKCLTYALSLSRRYAEKGDYEIAEQALAAAVSINASYVQAKGRTFFTVHPFFDNPLATDGFISDTLEHLARDFRSALVRKDDQHMMLSLRAMESMSRVYLSIDYASEHASKFHSHLAGGYLCSALKDATPTANVEVLMEGIRLLGRLNRAFLVAEGPSATIRLTHQIAELSCACFKTARYESRSHAPVGRPGDYARCLPRFPRPVS